MEFFFSKRLSIKLACQRLNCQALLFGNGRSAGMKGRFYRLNLMEISISALPMVKADQGSLSYCYWCVWGKRNVFSFSQGRKGSIKGLISFSLTLNLSLFNSISFARWCLVCAALIQEKPSWSWRCALCATSTRIYGTLCHQNGARPDAVVKHRGAHCTLVFWCFRWIRLCNIAHLEVASSFLLEIPCGGVSFPLLHHV